MRAVEVTIQNLIGSGMDPKTENNPYLGFIYTSFQERATKARAGWEQSAACLSCLCLCAVLAPRTRARGVCVAMLSVAAAVRASQVAHGNTARFAKEHGDDTLSKVRGGSCTAASTHGHAWCACTRTALTRTPLTTHSCAASSPRMRVATRLRTSALWMSCSSATRMAP
jgi:hypothetical protein